MFISNILNEIITKYSSVIFNFINTILVTRLLSDEGRGQYALYTNFIQFVILFLSFSVSSSIINKVANDKFKVGEVLISLIIYFFIVSVSASLIIHYLGLSESIFRTNQNIIFILIIAILNFFVTAMNTVFF